MTVESVVDDYLAAVHTLLGTTPAPAGSPPPPASPSPTPNATWLGGAHEAAMSAGQNLQQAREHLTQVAVNAATITDASAHIADDASRQLETIVAEWRHDKTAAAALPSPQARDSALLSAARDRINDAIALITATSNKYNNAATQLRAHTDTLPPPDKNGVQHRHDPTNPPPDHDGPTPPSSPPSADAPLPDSTLAAAAANPSPANPLPGAAGMLPTLMGAATSLPTTIAPMASAIPAAAATPLASLSSLTQPASSFTGAGNPSGASSHQDVNLDRVPKTGSVAADIDAALDEVGITDPQARARWHAGYEVLIKRESGGNVDAVNRTDSNAHGATQPDGAPAGSSRGLTQVTPGTFRQFHAPGTSSDIYDPVANIAASIRYVIAVHHVSPSGVDLAEKVAQANPNSAGGGY